jgi:hypothetical protein
MSSLETPRQNTGGLRQLTRQNTGGSFQGGLGGSTPTLDGRITILQRLSSLGGEVAKLQQEGPKAGASADDLPVGEINLEKGKPAVVMKRAWLDNSQIADTAEARKRALLQGLATAALRSQVKYGDDERMRREAKGALPVVAMGLAYKDIEMALERIDPENESGGKATKKLSYPSGVGDKQHMGSRSKLGFGLGRKAFYYCFQEGEMLVWDAKGDLDKYIAKSTRSLRTLSSQNTDTSF